jgi:formylglycine-generating enzyme required for sulfatase activity
LTDDCRIDLKDFAVLADGWMDLYEFDDLASLVSQWLTEGASGPDITWVYIDDTGFSGEGYIGEMSKYETTNAQYCAFLNSALASGDIIVSGNTVYGANGSNAGNDFAGEIYYQLDGIGYDFDGAVNGGAARINYDGSSFTVESGMGNHPVNYVSWYGATAFCHYYGFRLPARWEWNAVADYKGGYKYGCGTTIDFTKANYRGSTHPHGTTEVGAFGEFGYGMCDMAGNVFEWVSEFSNGSGAYRGGSWNLFSSYCLITYESYYPALGSHNVGFRVCR